jgi:hypothetical protein
MFKIKDFIFIAALACGASYAKPTAESPPIKMGLWEVSSFKEFSFMSKPMVSTYQACLTPTTWRSAFASGDCIGKSTSKKTPSEWTVDIKCEGGTTVHSKITFESQEKIHSVLSTSSSNIVENAVYLGADCKGVTPNPPKVPPIFIGK